MKYILTSSPLYDERNEVIPDNGFIGFLRALLPSEVNALYVCSEPDERELTEMYWLRLLDSFIAAGINIVEYDILDRQSDSHAEELINKADWIILAGGHVPTQNAYFQEIGLREKLQGYEGLVMGSSAGSMNMADTVYAEPEYELELGDLTYKRWIPGLGITTANILPHYNLNAEQRLLGRHIYKDIARRDSFNLPEGLAEDFRGFFVLPDGSFILGDLTRSENGSLKRTEHLFGEALIIKNGVFEALTDNGDVIRI